MKISFPLLKELIEVKHDLKVIYSNLVDENLL